MRRTKNKNVSLFPILLVNFIGTLGYSIVLPFLVFLVTKFQGNALTYGILGAVYPAFQLIGAPILGKWSDSYGRKKILLLSQIGTLIGWIIFLIALFLPAEILYNTESLIITLPLFLLFISRAIDGLTGGNISVANAYLADITTEAERNKNFGKMSISANLGFVAGPLLAGILGGTELGEKLPVIAEIFISIATLFIILFLLPETRPQKYLENPERNQIKKVFGYEHKECFKTQSSGKNNNLSFKKVLKLKNIAYFLLLYFLIFLGFNFFYTAFPIHSVQKLGWNITEIGIFFSVLSILMVIVQGPILSIASKKYSERTLILVGSVVLGMNFIMLIFTNTALIYFAALLFAFGNGLMWPSFLSLQSKAATAKYQGVVQGYASSSGSLASIIGLIIGGILYSAIGAGTFIAAAIVIFIVFLLALRLMKPGFKSELAVDIK